MMSAEERYHRDPEFRALVEVIRGWIERLQYTPTEVREAAMLAALQVSMNSTSNVFRVPHPGKKLVFPGDDG